MAPRFPVAVPAVYISRTSGSGTTFNMSVSGVRVDQVSTPVLVGTELTLRFSIFPGSFDTPFLARVVRHTESGFAAQFAELERPQMELLRRALPTEYSSSA